MKRLFSISLLILLTIPCLAGESLIDSVLRILPGTEGTKKVDMISYMLWDMEHTGRYEEAIKYGEIGLQLADSLDYNLGRAKIYNHLGAVYKNKGDYTRSLDFLQRSEKFFTLEKNEAGLAAMSLNLGNLLSSMGENKKAIEKYNNALTYGIQTKDTAVIAVCLANMGTIFQATGDLVSAEKYYREALVLREIQKDTAGIAALYNNIGIIYLDKKDYPQAEKYYLIYYDLAKRAHLPIDMIIGQLNLGEVSTFLGKYDEGFQLLEQGLRDAVKIGSRELEQSAYETIFAAWERKGNPEKAFFYAELLRDIKDSILNTENSRVLAELETKFETEKKDQEMSLLQQDNTIKDLQSNMTRDELLRKNTMKYGSFAGLVLLLVMVLFILKSSMEQKKANALLDSRNKELEMQKNIIEQKNSLINDSIEYASIIQQTLFPSSEQLSAEFGKLRLQHKKSTGIGNYSYALEKFGKTLVFFFIQSRLHGVSGSLHSLRVFHELRNLCSRQAQFEPAIIARFLEASGSKDLQLLTAFRTEHNNELHLVGSPEFVIRNSSFVIKDGPAVLSLDGNTPFLVESREAGVQIQFG